MSILINDCVLIASINFNGNIIELTSYSKIDVYKGEQLFEILEVKKNEGIAMLLEENNKYIIKFDNNKIFEIIVNNRIGINICFITPNKGIPFKIYKDVYVYHKSDGNILYAYDK